MSVGLIDLSIMNDIADAINLKLGSSGTMTPTQMASNIISIPSGSGTTAPSTFISNGVYPASSDNLDGYSIVTVSVPTTSLSQLSVSANGSYIAPSGYSYDEVTVDVPTVTLSSATFSSNSIYSAAAGTGYSEVTVDVPVPTMSTLSVNTNGSYAAPGGVAYNQVDVDVPGTPLSSITISVNGSYSAAQGTGYDDITVDVQPTLSNASFNINGEYSIPAGYDGYGTVTVSVPGGAVLGSKTISMNGVYNAIDDNLNGYDVVTVDVDSDIGTYEWYDDGIDVTVTVDDVNLTLSTQTTSFYDNYCTSHINTLTVNAGTSTSIGYINTNPWKKVLFKKLVIGSDITRLSFNNMSQVNCMRELDIQSVNLNINNDFCRYGSYLIAVSFPLSASYSIAASRTFANCYRLQKVTLPTGLSIIPADTFYSCNSLISINLENLTNLTQIRANAFNNCYNIKDIDFTKLSNLTTIEGNSFAQTGTGIKKLKSTSLTTIGNAAFSYCQDLEEADIQNVINLGSNVFSYCYNLKKVILSLLLTQIPQGVFSYCESLVDINLSNITDIDASAFSYCYKLTNIDLSSIVTIGQYGFSYTGIVTLVLPSTLTSLGNACFSHTENLTSIDLSACTLLTSLPNNCFEYTSSLSQIILPNTITTLGSSCFQNSNIANIDISNITSLGAYCFNYCSNLTSINLNNTISQIPNYCFYSTGLTSVEIPASVTTIASNAFNTSTLKTLILYDTNVISTASSSFTTAITDIYYRGSQGKTASDLETEYNTRYGSNSYLKPTATRTVNYIPYEDWNV